mgnify:CR=1 FL=1
MTHKYESKSPENVVENESDMRMKKCKICNRVKRIHKWDAFCNSCKSKANSIRRFYRFI